jgi:uncharacterized protein (DUF1800 family)
MARPAPLIEHLYRRAGFGLSPAERAEFSPAARSTRTGRSLPGANGESYREVVEALLAYDTNAADAVDLLVGQPGYVGITTTGPFTPNTDVGHARQRWLFRMVHSPAPLQEKMALVWHQQFATAFSKISGLGNAVDATRLMAAKPSTDAAGQRGQIELFRQFALGDFEDLLVAVAKDPAMLQWLDGYTNTKNKPQENFGRELMELFTVGVDHYVESDVYAAARVFSGWNLQTTGTPGSGSASYAFSYKAANHETSAKDFSFPIYGRGSSTPNRVPARSATSGMQDGLDLIHALAFHPETALRMARRLWTWFVSEMTPPDPGFVQSIAKTYLDNGTNMRAVMRAVLMSPQFQNPASFYQRYAWPAEFVVRALKEVGYRGFSVNDALTPMLNMGQSLFEPPDVAGWGLGQNWFSTGGMLARMNFASQLATNQKFALRDAARPFGASQSRLVNSVYDTLSLPAPAAVETAALTGYVSAGGFWTGSDAQLLTKTAGLYHLLTASGEYQFV